jgi:SAM-dependent methyltransferase
MIRKMQSGIRLVYNVFRFLETNRVAPCRHMLHAAAGRMPILRLRKPFLLMNRPLYNQLVTYYELVEGRDWQSEIKLIASILKDNSCKSVVDLGCGTGYHARTLTKLGFETTGIDISKQNILFAKKEAMNEKVRPRFIVGSYYEYHPTEFFDAALCLNWSIPVKDKEVRRFLDNTNSLLRLGGVLIFDLERVSQIAWDDVGKPITHSWNRKHELIVRVSVGQIVSNVLYSRDVYLIYPSLPFQNRPDERLRYKATGQIARVQMYVDRSCVRFFSMPEIRWFARRSGFKVTSNYLLHRDKYKRNYAVLEKVR